MPFKSAAQRKAVFAALAALGIAGGGKVLHGATAPARHRRKQRKAGQRKADADLAKRLRARSAKVTSGTDPRYREAERRHTEEVIQNLQSKRRRKRKKARRLAGDYLAGRI